MTTPQPPSSSTTTIPSPESPCQSQYKVTLIVAYSLPTYSIGLNGKLPWHYPEDLTFFKSLTLNSTIIMGRKTWDSLPVKPLLSRANVIITYQISPLEVLIPGVWAAGSLKEAITTASLISRSPDTFIIGGASIYEEALSKGLVDEIIATEIAHHHPGDTFFPAHHLASWQHTTTLLSTPDFTTKVYTPLSKEKKRESHAASNHHAW